MKNIEIKLRAHHGMCLAFFEGKGYSAGFTAHMARILEYLEQENPTVTVVAEADCICGGCPNLTDGRCRKAALVEPGTGESSCNFMLPAPPCLTLQLPR